jgi:hypothetical protein
MPAVMPMVMPWAIPADLVRPVMGPDHPAIAVRITVIGGIVGRSVEAPEVMPVSEVRPDVGLTIAAMVECAIAAVATAAEHRRSAKPAAVKAAPVETTTAETSAVKTSTTVEAAASTVETATAMAATTMTATTAMAAANLDHRAIGRDFR